MSDIGVIGWAFAAGILAAVNPCGFAVLPGFVAGFLAPEASPRSGVRAGVHGLITGLSVTAGKLSVFAVVAAVFLAGGRTVVRIAPWTGASVGGALLLLGLWTLAGRALHVPVPALRPPRGTGYRSAYVFGLVYGTVSLSCCLPIFLGVFAGLGAGIVGSVGGSAALFMAYGLGIAAIIVPLFTVTGNVRDKVVIRMRLLSRIAGPAGAVLLTLAGALLLATWLPLLGGSPRVNTLARTVLWWQAWAQRVVIDLGTGFWAAAAVTIVAIVAYPVLREHRRGRSRLLDETGAGAEALLHADPEEVGGDRDQHQGGHDPQTAEPAQREAAIARDQPSQSGQDGGVPNAQREHDGAAVEGIAQHGGRSGYTEHDAGARRAVDESARDPG